MEKNSTQTNDARVIFVTGGTGAGKSYLCNKIANAQLFKEGDDIVSETSRIEEKDCYLGGKPEFPIRLVDTVGAHDNRTSRGILTNYIQSMGQAQKGFNMILQCYNALNTRFDRVHIEDLRKLSQIYQKGVNSHVYIVFTHLNRVSDEEKQEITKKYMRLLAQILKDHYISGISEKQILFFDSTHTDCFIEKLAAILPRQARYRAYENFDLSNPLNILEDAKSEEFIKSVVEAWKLDLKSLEEFKSPETAKEKELLDQKICLMEVLIKKKGKNIETILKAIKDKNEFCKDLAHFFLSSQKPKKGEQPNSVYGVIYKHLSDFNSTYAGTHYLKKGYIEVLQKQLNESTVCKINECLIQVISKNLKKTFHFDEKKLPLADISSFPLGGLCAGAGLGLVAASFVSNLTWAVRGISTLSGLINAGILTTEVATAATTTTAATAATVGLSTVATLGIGLVVSSLVLGASFFIWSEDGAIDDVADGVRKKFLEEAGKKMVIAALITYCDLAELSIS